MNCITCKKELCYDHIGAYKKFINRGASEFECRSCLAKTLKIDENELEKKIEFLRRHGCTLFN